MQSWLFIFSSVISNQIHLQISSSFMYEMKVVWQWSVPNSCSEPPVLKNGVFHDWHVLNGFSTVVMYMLVCSGVTSLGSGWAYPRAPGLRGHSSEGEHIFKTLFYFVDPHNYALFGCPSNPLEHDCTFWVPLSNPLEHVNFGCPSPTSLERVNFECPRQ